MKRLRYLAGWCIIALLAACGSTSIYVPIVRPYEIDLEGKQSLGAALYYQNQAIEYDAPVSAHEGTDVFIRALAADRRFSLFSLYQYNGLIRASYDESVFTVQNIRELRRETSADAFIICEIYRFRYEEDIISADVNRYYKSDGKQIVRKGILDAGMRVRIVNSATQTMIWDDTLEVVERTETSAADKEPPAIDSKELASEALRALAGNLLELTKQVTESVLVTFLDDGQYPEVQTAVKHARRGEWTDAIAWLQQTAERSKGTEAEHKMQYNLGIAYQYSGNFRMAMECFDRALALKDSQRYKIARNDCLTMERSYMELMDQQE